MKFYFLQYQKAKSEEMQKKNSILQSSENCNEKKISSRLLNLLYKIYFCLKSYLSLNMLKRIKTGKAYTLLIH